MSNIFVEKGQWLEANLVEPSKAHASTLDPATQFGDDQEVGKAAGLHLQVQLQDWVGMMDVRIS